MKSKFLKRGVICGVLALTIITASCMIGAAVQSQENEDAYSDLLAAVEDQMQVGIIPAEELSQEVQKRNAFSKQTIDNAIQEVEPNVQFEEHIESDLADKYESRHESLLNNASVDSTLAVGAGILNPHLVNVENKFDSEKQMKITYISWLSSIEPVNDQYNVRLIFNRDTRILNVIKDGDTWKWDGSEEDGSIKEFYPSSYSPVKGTFASYEEAVAFAATLDVEAENPF